MQIFNFNKRICTQKCVQLNCIWQSTVYMMLLYWHLVLRWFDIANPFLYFNLTEVDFHPDQERKVHAINYITFFAKAFIRRLNGE